MRSSGFDGIFRDAPSGRFYPREYEEMPLEKPVFPLTTPGQMLADFGGTYAARAGAASLCAASGPAAIILAVGARGGLSESDIASWIFGAFFLNGLMSIGFSILY